MPSKRTLNSFGSRQIRYFCLWAVPSFVFAIIMKDYLSAIDEVSKEPFVDRDHLGCVGASFGGFSVYWLAGHHETKTGYLISISTDK